MGLRKPPISILIQHGSPHSSPLLICEGVLHADPVERIVLLHQCPADWRSQTQHGASFFAEAAGDTFLLPLVVSLSQSEMPIDCLLQFPIFRRPAVHLTMLLVRIRSHVSASVFMGFCLHAVARERLCFIHACGSDRVLLYIFSCLPIRPFAAFGSSISTIASDP